MVAFTAGEDDDVSEGSFVAIDPAGGREILEVIGGRPLQVAGLFEREQTDFGRDLQTADERITGGEDEPGLGGAERDGGGGGDGDVLRFAGLGIKTRGDVDGKDRNTRTIDALNELSPIRFEGAIQTDAEKTVDDEGGSAIEERTYFVQGARWIGDVEQLDASINEMRLRVAGVIAVVTFAGENENPVVLASHAEGGLRDGLAGGFNDVGFGAPGIPGCFLPLAHLLDRYHRQGHGGMIAWKRIKSQIRRAGGATRKSYARKEGANRAANGGVNT